MTRIPRLVFYPMIFLTGFVVGKVCPVEMRDTVIIPVVLLGAFLGAYYEATKENP